MGATLHLGFDDTFPGPTKHSNNSFFYEIVSGGLHSELFNLDNFLNEEEKTILYPDYDTFQDTLDNYRRIDPKKLQDIFIKTYVYLKDNSNKIPLTGDEKVFFQNKFEQYKDNLQELIDICDKAIKEDRKLLWIFSN